MAILEIFWFFFEEKMGYRVTMVWNVFIVNCEFMIQRREWLVWTWTGDLGRASALRLICCVDRELIIALHTASD